MFLQTENPPCHECGTPLIVGQNWSNCHALGKRQYYICRDCANKKQRALYAKHATITTEQKKCSKCEITLVVGKNWLQHFQRDNRLICNTCNNIQISQRFLKNSQKANKCNRCGTPLIVGENWAEGNARQNNHICKSCVSEYYYKLNLNRKFEFPLLHMALCSKCQTILITGENWSVWLTGKSKHLPKHLCKTCWNKSRNKYYQKIKKRVSEQRKQRVKTPQQIETTRLRGKEYRLRIKLVTFQALGGKCARCGFSDHRALQIDHVNGGGMKERKLYSNNLNKYYLAILDEVRASGTKYQLLCANCNWIKREENNEARKSRQIDLVSR